MPIFEYKCPGCGKVDEVLQKNARAKKVVCPGCGKAMQKVFSSFSVGVAQAGASSKCISCTDRGCPHASGMN